MTTPHTKRIAIYPGSFDPLTNGHVDLIERAARLFDRVIVAILVNAEKTPLLPTDERIALTRSALAHLPAVEVDSFDGLLVEYASRRGAAAIVRGARNAGDFEYEWPMTQMNRRLRPEIETVLVVPAVEVSAISSRLVKEIWRLGGEIGGLVPPAVEARLRARRARGE